MQLYQVCDVCVIWQVRSVEESISSEADSVKYNHIFQLCFLQSNYLAIIEEIVFVKKMCFLTFQMITNLVETLLDILTNIL